MVRSGPAMTASLDLSAHYLREFNSMRRVTVIDWDGCSRWFDVNQ